jgi:AP-3 complex subunit delta-1
MNTLNFFSGKSLQDIVKGLRAQPTAEGRNAYAAQALQECRTELASVDPALKANAASKVAHFRMLGYDDANLGDDDTSFHVIESMASAQFRYKRQGTLAAARLLSSNSRVLLLATNTLKKELKNPEPYVSGLALGAISCFVSRELARDLLPDVMQSLQSSKPYVRKRAMLCLYRMCQAYPEGLHEAYDAMRARLEDPDASVVGCAVNAVCELSRSNAKSVLPLTPQLFRLLTSSSNNWMLIKIVKLYSALLAVEPRLARKLLEPLVHNIKTTSAKSLLFECISTVTRALRHVPTAPEALVNDVVNVCAAKLKEFVLDSDQNLKYLGLVGFIELTKSHPTVASSYKVRTCAPATHHAPLGLAGHDCAVPGRR